MTRAHRDTLQRELQGATRERMLREMAELLEVLTAARPLLLVFEDLQWVDHATVDLLAALARRRAPAQLLLVGTYRPVDLAFGQHPLRALTQELLVHQLCHELAVEPLGEADVAAYLAAAAAGAPLPEGLAGLVYRHSEGNPLFMRAVLDHLTQQGLLAREPDGWQLRVPIADIAIGVPESVRQMIDAQIARLRPEEQRLLEVASVAGAVFTASVCAAAADQEPEHFEALCETLARRQHLVRASGPPQVLPDGSLAPRYAFVHALYREVCYGRQAPGRRATLHRRLGERMEVVFATQLHDVAAELAYHFEAGAAWARAVTYLRLVADTAGQRYAYREAATTLQHALALVPHLPETPARTQHCLDTAPRPRCGTADDHKGTPRLRSSTPTPRPARCVSRWARRPSWSRPCSICGGFILPGRSCRSHASSGRRCWAWRNLPMTPPSRSSPTMPWGVRGCGLGPCLPPVGIWKQASHARRQTSTVRRGSGWSTSWGWPAA